MRTIAITGSASGMGLATADRLQDDGHRVIGVDLRDADVIADLSTPQGRQAAIAEMTDVAGGRLDGLVTYAGLGGLPDRAGSLVASVNYFGTVELLDGLRPLLAEGDEPAAVAVGSNSTTCQPNVPEDLIDALLEGDEDRARQLADGADSVNTYPATKVALTRWARRQAPTPEWAGAGITLNVVAPGLIDTALTQEQRHDETMGPLIDMFPLPLGRGGRPEEVAAFVAYLLGPDARFFCGSVLFVDGGTDALLRADSQPATWNP